MNDIELAFSISQEIGTLYKAAKDYSFDLPDYSLGQLRSLSPLICDLIATCERFDFTGGGDIDKKIFRLFNEQLIDSKTKDCLHLLRRNGNAGTHPEKFFLRERAEK